MKHSYIIVDDNHESILNTQASAMRFQNLAYMGYATNYEAALNLILEHQPSLIFLEINPLKKESNLSLNLINELYRYLTIVPKIIVTSKDQSLVFRAMEYGVADYLMKPLEINAFRKAIFKFEKSVSLYAIPTPIVQQSVPQQALTFSDFLRQEPIEKPTTKEETPSIVSIEDKKKSEDIQSLVVEEEILEQNNQEETVIEVPTDEFISAEREEIVPEETTEIESNTATSQEESIVEEKETIENFNLPEEILEEAITSDITESEETTKETDEEKIIENQVESEVESEEIQTQETSDELEEDTETLETETVEETLLQEESNDDGAIRILPGQKVIVEQEQPLVICVKSYGDYRYIDSGDVIYFEADNNSVDIHLKNGEMVTAFKTLKVFETVLPLSQFLRIHNSYIININQVARIHTGNSVCYIKNSTIKLPFSKSYKENVDLIIHRIASGNYIEI